MPFQTKCQVHLILLCIDDGSKVLGPPYGYHSPKVSISESQGEYFYSTRGAVSLGGSTHSDIIHRLPVFLSSQYFLYFEQQKETLRMMRKNKKMTQTVMVM